MNCSVNKQKRSSVLCAVIGSESQNDCSLENKEIQETGTYAEQNSGMKQLTFR